MRRLLLVLLLALVPASLFAQQNEPAQPNNVAHGAEKAAHEQTHPTESHDGGAGHAPKTYFGMPAWLLKLANMILFIAALAWVAGGPVKKSMAERRELVREVVDMDSAVGAEVVVEREEDVAHAGWRL